VREPIDCSAPPPTAPAGGRLKSDTSLRPAHPPRAPILSTGEERPSGESLIARMFLVEIAPSDIDPVRLTARQRDAACGLYAQATAGYIACWCRGSTRSAPISRTPV
jgi:hypothetical protein